jgi:hypothetical protein
VAIAETIANQDKKCLIAKLRSDRLSSLKPLLSSNPLIVVVQIFLNIASCIQAMFVIQVSANSGSHEVWCAGCAVAAIASCFEN